MTEIKYSVVIISYNEEKNIRCCIDSIRCGIKNKVQIILSDGGSTDLTIRIASEESIEIINSKIGRGIQSNAGAELAFGDILLFLHSDTTLPKNAFEILDNYFSIKDVKIGTFRLSFDWNNPILKFYSLFTTIDSMFTRYGDQCIVIRKDFFQKLGGFKNWPLYEDVDLLKRARKLTKIYSFPASVVTSSRRYTEKGAVKQQLASAWNMLQFLLGKSPDELAKKYNNLRKVELMNADGSGQETGKAIINSVKT